MSHTHVWHLQTQDTAGVYISSVKDSDGFRVELECFPAAALQA